MTFLNEISPEEMALLDSTIVDKRPVDIRPTARRFAFYGRVSTDELRGLQDSVVSRKWQYDRAAGLIRDSGEIVTEFFDEGYSRSIPFIRRPKGAELLELVVSRKANFDALVVGEAKRVFAGSQLEDVYYQLNRAGIELWIPEVQGKYDENNITHKMILSFEGIMGRVESDTVRGRVRDAMTSIATSSDRRWLGGNAPYGYQLAILEQVDKKGGASGSRGKGFTQTLELNPETAPIARRIFDEYLSGKSLREIATHLELDHTLSPTGRDEWHVSTLSTILDNQTYTGVRIYGKQRKTQIPFDEDDPRMGTVAGKTRLGEPPVRSSVPVYPAIITIAEFGRVSDLRKSKRTLTAPRKKAVQRTYESEPLRGRVYWNGKKLTLDKSRHGKIRYRSNEKDGTGRVSVYDIDVRDAVHTWLSVNLSRKYLPQLIEQLKASAPKMQSTSKKIEAEITRKRTAANNLLTLVEQGDVTAVDRYKLRLAEIRELENQLRDIQATNLDVNGITVIMRKLGAETRKEVLDKASNQRLNRLYDALGLSVEYLPEEQAIRLRLAPSVASGLGSGISHLTPTPQNALDQAELSMHRVGAKGGAPGGTRTPNRFLRTELLFH
jgi:site-specific DNA recombinase